MVHIDVLYAGDLRCTAAHGPSGRELQTDAPVDNRGRGESFSPTDLVATALGTCMATVMGIHARDAGLPLEGTRIHVTKEMTAAPPRRIARLAVRVTIPAGAAARIPDHERARLEHIADTCPVRLSVAGSIDVPVTFDWLA